MFCRRTKVNKFQLEKALLIKPSTQWFGQGDRVKSLHKYMNKPTKVDGVWVTFLFMHLKEIARFVFHSLISLRAS